MFIIVAIDAEVFPVGAVGRIVVVVAVFMMDGEQMFVVFVKLPGAFRADQTMNLQRLFAIGRFVHLLLFELFDDFVCWPVTLRLLQPL